MKRPRARRRVLVCCLAGLAAVGALLATGTSYAAVAAPAANLSLTVNPANSGIINGLPNGLGCTSSCSVPIPAGQQVTLSVLPVAGFQFAGWSGCPGTTPQPTTCRFTMPAAGAKVTATFGVPAGLVTVAIGGSGTGTVNGPGINCPGDCTESFPIGTFVSLTATAGNLSTFVGWNGACSGPGSCSFTVTGNTTVAATFTRPTSSTVPNVLLMPSDAASDALAAAGLTMTVIGEVEDTVACDRVGTIASQNPAAGAVVPFGSAVSVRVYVRPAPPRVCA
jgi:hypothetical protein